MSASESNPPSDSPIPPTDATQAPVKPKRRRLLRNIGILALAFIVFSAAGIGGAEYYTARPQFCGTCHVMDPYYVSWSHDKHGGQDVWCVECHYAPGEHHTIMAKMRGLSQLASYFTGRYGAGRPRAHVSDASCMRSGCHGDNAFLEKKLAIGQTRTEERLVGDVATEVERVPSVKFNHAVHLKVDDRLATTNKALATILKKLGEHMSAVALAGVRRAAVSVLPVAERKTAMIAELRKHGAEASMSDALELMRLEHERLRFLQLESISCSSCHTYDATSKNHFAVDQQSCFVCHFTNQEFNQDTGSCLRCHEPPERKIFVHGAPPPATAAADSSSQPSPGPLLDHKDIVARGINCESCHADVIRGASTVSGRDCTHCHDQQHFLDGFEERTTETVADYHRTHVAKQRARCSDCHRSVAHSLVDPTHVASSTDFLAPVIDDCQHCHPSHHREQVQLLAGTGGHGVPHALPNAMFGSRLNCRACHTEAGSDFKGGRLVEASKTACAVCHGDDYRALFDQWVAELKTYVEEVESGLARVDAALQAAKQSNRAISDEIMQRVENIRANLQFVRSGNGIHNKNYALQILEVCKRDMETVTNGLRTE